MRKTSRLQRWVEENKDKHLCLCGCREYVVPTRWRYYRGRSLRFIPGHNNRGVHHPNYRGGVTVSDGYVLILDHSHPRANPRGYVRRSWLVIEAHLGRHLRRDELVHHLNADKRDDRLENLLVVSRSDHTSMHKRGCSHPAYRADIVTERDIVPLRDQGLSYRKIAKRLRCSPSTVGRRLLREGVSQHSMGTT